MSKHLTTLAATAALAALFSGCAEAEPPEPAVSLERPTASTVFSSQSSDQPLPADEVFFPDAYAEDDTLYFRVQMLPGYYLYKDKIGVRSLSEGVAVDGEPLEDKWSASEIVVDEWFGEQAVFYIEASGAARLDQQETDVRSVEIELTYQGCKEEGLCYLPKSKVLSVEFPAQLKSAADQTE
jgi:thiol:disulfide interchange protein DsbD